MGFRRWWPRILWEAGSTAAGGRVGERRHGARSVQEFGWGEIGKNFCVRPGSNDLLCDPGPVFAAWASNVGVNCGRSSDLISFDACKPRPCEFSAEPSACKISSRY
jgi:hypothetical protein